MNRRVFLLSAAGSLILANSAFAAASHEEDVARALVDQGYRITSRRRTLLGRVRFTAAKGRTEREVVLDPSSGEILRDYSRIDGGGDRPERSGDGGAGGTSSSGGGNAAGDGGGAQGGGDGSSSGGEPSGGDGEGTGGDGEGTGGGEKEPSGGETESTGDRDSVEGERSGGRKEKSDAPL